MSNKESNKKNQRKIRENKRAGPESSAFLLTQSPPNFSLYRFVYQSTLSTVVCFVLILSFFSQGVLVVFADESNAGDELVTIPLVENPEPELEPAPEPETNPPIVEDLVDNQIETVADETTPPPQDDESLVTPTESEDTTSSPLLEADSLPETSLTVDEQSETEVIETSSSGGSNDESETLEETSGDNTATTSTDNLPVENIPDTEVIPDEVETDASADLSGEFDEATTTAADLLGPVMTEAVSVNYSDSGFVFSKNECTELASGSFYCLEPQENVLEDALFAAPDKDGDLEVFLVRNSIQTQVTDNTVDDAAPFFDQNSETIVWHRLIEDRYQIISYDLASGEETQITKGSTNNMEPIRQGKYTVWQRWVGNNWDIILFDGAKEIQVSHASAHDIAPYIHGSLVVWNRYGSTGEKTIEMYDIASETYVTVNDPEGLSVTNPRMVLVYDQMHPNGDIVTKGYDMIARKFIQLDTLPRELPDEIPESEPTNETRALIQSKPSVKGDDQVKTEPLSGSEPPLGDAVTAATSTDPLTLDLRVDETPVAVTIDTTVPELLDYDLVITPLPATTTESAVESVQE